MPSRVPCSIHPSLAPLLAAALLVAACKGDDPPPASDETGSSTGGSSSTGTDPSATSGMVTTAPPPMTTVGDDTTYGAGCGPDPCPEMCGRGCESTGTCIASVWMCECACDSTGTMVDPCGPFPEVLDAWVEPSQTPALDCGTVGPKDDAAAWETAHGCILLQAAGSSFRAVWSLPDGSDPFLYGAAARVIDGSHEIGWFQTSGTSMLVESTCDEIVATPDCVVDVGTMCLTCVGQREVAVLCEDPA